MKVLDLFAGLKGWSQPFADLGHETFTIDFDKRFDVDLHIDIMELKPSMVPWVPDIILASPPCTQFTVMRIGANWTHDHKPKNEKTQAAMDLLDKTVKIMDYYRSRGTKYCVLENPRAKMRRIVEINYPQLERRTVTYCHYGEKRMKPTDLWGWDFPPSLVLHPTCKNGDPCHTRAPRGSTTGTQGMDSAESAKIPYALARDVCLAAELDL